MNNTKLTETLSILSKSLNKCILAEGDLNHQEDYPDIKTTSTTKQNINDFASKNDFILSQNKEVLILKNRYTKYGLFPCIGYDELINVCVNLKENLSNTVSNTYKMQIEYGKGTRNKLFAEEKELVKIFASEKREFLKSSQLSPSLKRKIWDLIGTQYIDGQSQVLYPVLNTIINSKNMMLGITIIGEKEKALSCIFDVPDRGRIPFFIDVLGRSSFAPQNRDTKTYSIIIKKNVPDVTKPMVSDFNRVKTDIRLTTVKTILKEISTQKLVFAVDKNNENKTVTLFGKEFSTPIDISRSIASIFGLDVKIDLSEKNILLCTKKIPPPKNIFELGSYIPQIIPSSMNRLMQERDREALKKSDTPVFGAWLPAARLLRASVETRMKDFPENIIPIKNLSETEKQWLAFCLLSRESGEDDCTLCQELWRLMHSKYLQFVDFDIKKKEESFMNEKTPFLFIEINGISQDGGEIPGFKFGLKKSAL